METCNMRNRFQKANILYIACVQYRTVRRNGIFADLQQAHLNGNIVLDGEARDSLVRRLYRH